MEAAGAADAHVGNMPVRSFFRHRAANCTNIDTAPMKRRPEKRIRAPAHVLSGVRLAVVTPNAAAVNCQQQRSASRRGCQLAVVHPSTDVSSTVTRMEQRECTARSALHADARRVWYQRTCAKREAWQWRALSATRGEAWYTRERLTAARRPLHNGQGMLRALDTHPDVALVACCTAESAFLWNIRQAASMEHWHVMGYLMPPSTSSSGGSGSSGSGNVRPGLQRRFGDQGIQGSASPDLWGGIQWQSTRSEGKLLAWTNRALGVYSLERTDSGIHPWTAPEQPSPIAPFWHFSLPAASSSRIQAAAWYTDAAAFSDPHPTLMLLCGCNRDGPFAGIMDQRERPDWRRFARFLIRDRTHGHASMPVGIWSSHHRLAPTLVGVVYTDVLQLHDARMLSTNSLTSSAASVLGQIGVGLGPQVCPGSSKSPWNTSGQNRQESGGSFAKQYRGGTSASTAHLWDAYETVTNTTMIARFPTPCRFSSIQPLPEDAQHPDCLSLAVTTPTFRRCAILDIDRQAFGQSVERGASTSWNGPLRLRWCFEPETEATCATRPYRAAAEDGRILSSAAPFARFPNSSNACEQEYRRNLLITLARNSSSVASGLESSPLQARLEQPAIPGALPQATSALHTTSAPLNSILSHEYRYPAAQYLQSIGEESASLRYTSWRFGNNIRPSIRADTHHGTVLLACPLTDQNDCAHLCLFDLSIPGRDTKCTALDDASVPLSASWILDEMLGLPRGRGTVSGLALGCGMPTPAILLGCIEANQRTLPHFFLGSI